MVTSVIQNLKVNIGLGSLSWTLYMGLSVYRVYRTRVYVHI